MQTHGHAFLRSSAQPRCLPGPLPGLSTEQGAGAGFPPWLDWILEQARGAARLALCSLTVDCNCPDSCSLPVGRDAFPWRPWKLNCFQEALPDSACCVWRPPGQQRSAVRRCSRSSGSLAQRTAGQTDWSPSPAAQRRWAFPAMSPIPPLPNLGAL